jgi:hypothetical protein
MSTSALVLPIHLTGVIVGVGYQAYGALAAFVA